MKRSKRKVYNIFKRTADAHCHVCSLSVRQGERLSHAVGIAFGLCLDRKQRRQAESADIELPEPPAGVDTGLAGFRRASITDRLTDPQECKPAGQSVSPVPFCLVRLILVSRAPVPSSPWPVDAHEGEPAAPLPEQRARRTPC